MNCKAFEGKTGASASASASLVEDRVIAWGYACPRTKNWIPGIKFLGMDHALKEANHADSNSNSNFHRET